MLIRAILALFFASTFVGCNSGKDQIAEDRAFYYTVTSPSELASELVDYLNSNLKNKRVAITNRSGQTWPFYEILDADENLPVDSLMPPHYFVHLLKEKGIDKIQVGEFFLDINVMLEVDTLPNYDLTIYQMDSLGLALSAQTGIHYINENAALDSVTLYDTFLKSIVRYSFK